jgi:putative SOS response-associated peptidase YedK
MCFKLGTPQVKRLKTALGGQYTVESYEPMLEGSAFAHPVVPAATILAPFTVSGMTWGFVPHWARSPEDAAKLANSTLNARCETIHELPSFRDAAEAGQRCLLFADGFYEWQHAGKEKIPYYITDKDEAPFAIGGLWSRWTDRATGTVHEGFSVITTPANELLAEIHNTKQRMPLILQKALWDEWLDEKVAPSRVQQLMKPLPDGLLKAKRLGELPPSAPTLFPNSA